MKIGSYNINHIYSPLCLPARSSASMSSFVTALSGNTASFLLWFRKDFWTVVLIAFSAAEGAHFLLKCDFIEPKPHISSFLCDCHWFHEKNQLAKLFSFWLISHISFSCHVPVSVFLHKDENISVVTSKKYWFSALSSVQRQNLGSHTYQANTLTLNCAHRPFPTFYFQTGSN